MLTFLLNLLLYISSVLMIIVVLLQPHKSEGALTPSTDSNIFGVSVDGGPLARVTAYLAVFMAAIIITLNYIG